MPQSSDIQELRLADSNSMTKVCYKQIYLILWEAQSLKNNKKIEIHFKTGESSYVSMKMREMRALNWLRQPQWNISYPHTAGLEATVLEKGIYNTSITVKSSNRALQQETARWLWSSAAPVIMSRISSPYHTKNNALTEETNTFGLIC